MTVSHQEIREIIINSARNTFSKFGFQKTTMNEIAKAVRKGKSSLYYYFKSKEEIFEAVVEKESRLLTEEIQSSIEKEDTPQKKIRTYFIIRTKLTNRLANFYEILKDEYYQHYSSITKIREKHFENELKMIRSILMDGVEKGIFVIRDIALTSEAIITALKGFEHAWASEKDFSLIERNIDGLLDVIFFGLNKRVPDKLT